MSPYHVRRTDREITEPDGLASILRRGRYATIAVCQDGAPYLFTLSYGYDTVRHALYFHVATEGRKLEALAADPRVCATVIIDGGYEPGACKHHYESVVLTGTMALVDRDDEVRHGMQVLIGQLEDDAHAVWERNKLDRDEPWKRLRVARLDIEDLTGKAGS
jgi:uncharacterized protein